jgi:hypothetical protein
MQARFLQLRSKTGFARGILSVADKSPGRDIFAPLPEV